MEPIIESLKNKDFASFENYVKAIRDYNDLLKIYTYCLLSLVTSSPNGLGSMKTELIVKESTDSKSVKIELTVTDTEDPNLKECAEAPSASSVPVGITSPFGEIDFISSMGIMINCGLKLSELKSLRSSILLIKTKELMLSYKFMVLASLKCTIDCQINELKKINITPKESLNYLSAFTRSFGRLKIPTNASESDTQSEMPPNNKKYTDEHIEKLWVEYNRYELVDRLIQLVDKFGHTIMINSGVKLMSISDSEKIPYSGMVNYYNKVVNKLKIYFDKLNRVTDIYKSLCSQFAAISNNHDVNISVDKYIKMYNRNDLDDNDFSDSDDDVCSMLL